MTQLEISYQSEPKLINNTFEALDDSVKNGIQCRWLGRLTHAQASFGFHFNWEELANQGADRLSGYIIIKESTNSFAPQKTEVDITNTSITMMTPFSMTQPLKYVFSFEYSLTPHYKELKKVSYDELFAPSDMTDAVLVVEEKRIHVNKAFLSIHSDYFKVLFSNNFKEGSLSEIEINDISYDDFGLLCSSFFPNLQFPNELGRRFLLSYVIRIVEYHLIHGSKIGIPKMIWLADEYGMEELLEKCIREMDSLEKAKQLRESEEFEKLSDTTRSKLCGRLAALL
ncbi:Protein CBR-BTB-19 [Caenorhabditis briggsae]|uniref:Protein CBR-BTB-19 n=1 Tax=Caenorhabditis briggsae TaxID=6238 RepID=A8WIZ3_CAEBR|nr:Protein CBR-BTB-19 [Caenorhabditis briggsae]CAP20438.2 Protein CBR-BTB-19 [Caenorhabditis briggsae]